ncbi:MAG: hypothetical protein ACP6IS_04880 [Candidatus Asgardarchaeia archaeon]
MSLNKYELFERYIENPEELDRILKKILLPDAYNFVFNFLATKMSDLDLFEVKFAIAVFYVNRGFPKQNAPRWADVVDNYLKSYPKITRDGVIKILSFLKEEKRKRDIKKFARRVDEFSFI